MTKTFKEFLYENFSEHLIEQVHSDIQHILDSDDIPPEHKFNHVSKTVRRLAKQNIDTGLEHGTPKKGSSRAVFFPRDHHDVTIDGTPTKLPVALKIAIHGHLDKFKHKDEQLLGEMQNAIEGDWYARQHHSVLSPGERLGEFHTNHDGILVPVVDSHKDDHHLTVAKTDKFSSKEFENATKNEDFPKGLKFKDVQHVLMHHYNRANGHHDIELSEHHQKMVEHPFVSSALDLVGNMGLHPGDFHASNIGIWEHPVTKRRYPVIRDYGYSTDIAREYSIRRRRQAAKYNGGRY